MSRIVKERDIDIYAAPDRWAGNPNVTLLQSGEILIVYRRSGFPIRGDQDPTLRPFSVKLSSLDEIGAAEPVMILDEDNSLTPAFFPRRDGLILTFFNRYGTHPAEHRAKLEREGRTAFRERDGLLFTREPITLMCSRDGVRWEPFSKIDIPGFAHPPAFRGNMVYARDGSILFSVYTAREPDGAMFALCIRSRDGGKHWHYVSEIAEHPNPQINFNETSLYRTATGRLIAFLRTGGESVHNIHTAVSEDDGVTWSPFQEHSVYGLPQDALRLTSGNVLLTYGVRQAPCGVRGKLLDPECTNIDDAEEFVIRDDSATGACGYPASIQLPDDTIFTVYYVTPDQQGPARIAGSILREVD